MPCLWCGGKVAEVAKRKSTARKGYTSKPVEEPKVEDTLDVTTPVEDDAPQTDGGTDFYDDLLAMAVPKLRDKLQDMNDRHELNHLVQLESDGKKRHGVLIALHKRLDELDPKKQAKLPPKPICWLDEDFNLKHEKGWTIVSGPTVHAQRNLLGVILEKDDGTKTINFKFSLRTGERVRVDAPMG